MPSHQQSFFQAGRLETHDRTRSASEPVRDLFRGARPTDHIYWVSWNLSLRAETLKDYVRSSEASTTRTRWPQVTFLVPHPRQVDPGVISRRAVDALRTASKRVSIRAVVSSTARRHADNADQPMPDVEAPIDGSLHAKVVLRVDRSGEPRAAVVGSFNASNPALESNLEVSVTVEDPSALGDLLSFVRRLERAAPASPLTGEDCPDRPRSPEPTEGPPGDANNPRDTTKPKQPPRPDRRDPIAVRRLAEAADSLLASWPPGDHDAKGWQTEVFEDLVAQLEDGAVQQLQRDLLYLPVGLGKTFIAIRFALHMTTERSCSCVYLVPNEWIQKTVDSALNLVLETAKSALPRNQRRSAATALERALASLFVVHRATQTLSPEAAEACGIVIADEVHNWNPDTHRYPPGDKGYSQILNRLAGTGPDNQGNARTRFILGLSATPCRFEQDRYQVTSFMKSFLGLDDAGLSGKEQERVLQRQRSPYRHLAFAIQKGLLSEPEFHPLSATEDPALRDYYESEVKFGDYSKVVLGRFWTKLDRDRAATTRSIAKRLVDLDCRRIVVFLPGVGSELNGWPESMTDAFQSASRDRVHGIDFRAKEGETTAASRRQFEQFARGSTGTARYILYTIDRFSEGVSVDDIDALVCLRATLSPRVAVQQIGRGLRLDVAASASNPRIRRRTCHVIDGVWMSRLLADWEKHIEDFNGEPVLVAPSDDATELSMRRAAIQYFELQMAGDRGRLNDLLGIRSPLRWERELRPRLQAAEPIDDNPHLRGFAKRLMDYQANHRPLTTQSRRALRHLTDGESWMTFLRTYYGERATAGSGDWMLAFRNIAHTHPRFRNQKKRDTVRLARWKQLPPGLGQAVLELLR